MRLASSRQVALIALGLVAVLLLVVLTFSLWPQWLEGILGRKKLFLSTLINGITLSALYFLVASGFTLIFGLMRNVNLAHGSLYLLGAYLGYSVGTWSGSWILGLVVGALLVAVFGVLLQVVIFRRMEGNDLRQTMVTIGLSILMSDLMLAVWGGNTYQFDAPLWMSGSVTLPLATSMGENGTPNYLIYPTFRLLVVVAAVMIGLVLWLMLNRTRLGMMVRAGVDDRSMLASIGVNVHVLFSAVFALGAGLAGLAGVIGGTALSISPGEDVRYLLASLVVVIVGGMGSISGAAVGALLIGLAEQFGLAYFPTYGVVLTFLIMVAALAWRPQGLMGIRV